MSVAASTDSMPAPAPQDPDRRAPITTVVWLGVVALISATGLAIAYRGGVFVTFGDPIVYISMARSFAAGHGASVAYGSIYTASPLTVGGPVSHWPPGYSLLLSIGSPSILGWAMILGAAFFAANVFLFGFLAHRLGVTRWGSIALAVVFAGGSFQMHGTVESEPLFFLLVLLGLHGLVSFFARPALPPLVVVAVAFGLSTVTRYIGEAFVIGGVIALLIFLKQSWIRRLWFGAVLAVVGNIPLAIWYLSIHNSPESLTFHLPGINALQTGLFTFAGYIVPGVHSTDLRTVIAAVIVIGVITMLAMVGDSRLLSSVRHEHIDWLMLLLAVTYLVLLFATRSFVDPLVLFISRQLFLPFVLLLLWCGQSWPRIASWEPVPRSSWGPPLATFLVCLVVASAIWTAFDAARQAQDGNLASSSATNTSLKRAVNSIPHDTVVYSDVADAVYLVTGRSVHLLPNTLSASTAKANPKYAAEVSSMQHDLCGRPATVVYSRTGGFLEPRLDQVEGELQVAKTTTLNGWVLLSLDTRPPC